MINIAIVGASGLVGQRLAELILYKTNNVKLHLFGQNSVGKKMVICNKSYVIKNVESLLTTKLDYALFCATEEVSQKYVEKLSRLGVRCIDNSSHFRLKKNVPLVVPSINGNTIKNSRIIANPNCTTIQIAMAVNALLEYQPTKVTAVTFQSASGAGKLALEDLQQKRSYGKLQTFEHPLFDNVIPKIGKPLTDGRTSEEVKIAKELAKILQLPHLKVNSFCTRIPVTIGHCAFVNVQLKRAFSVEDVKKQLQNEQNVLVFDDLQRDVYPMPILFRQTKYVGVGRIVKDVTSNGINMFVVADNLLRGASYNAFEILQSLVGKQ